MKTSAVLLFCSVLLLALLAQLLSLLFTRMNEISEEQTKLLCWQYAVRNHEKEFVPERWERVKDLWTADQWYQSCINHSKNI